MAAATWAWSTASASEMVAQTREVEVLGKDLFVVGKVPGAQDCRRCSASVWPLPGRRCS